MIGLLVMLKGYTSRAGKEWIYIFGYGRFALAFDVWAACEVRRNFAVQHFLLQCP